MLYRKLKRTWAHGYAEYIPNLTTVFPELKYIKSEELCDRLRRLNLEFYYEVKTPVKPWIRLTLPLALIMWLLMFIGLPFTFIITGSWGYGYNDKNIIRNWFKQLRL